MTKLLQEASTQAKVDPREWVTGKLPVEQTPPSMQSWTATAAVPEKDLQNSPIAEPPIAFILSKEK